MQDFIEVNIVREPACWLPEGCYQDRRHTSGRQGAAGLKARDWNYQLRRAIAGLWETTGATPVDEPTHRMSAPCTPASGQSVGELDRATIQQGNGLRMPVGQGTKIGNVPPLWLSGVHPDLCPAGTIQPGRVCSTSQVPPRRPGHDMTGDF